MLRFVAALTAIFFLSLSGAVSARGIHGGTALPVIAPTDPVTIVNYQGGTGIYNQVTHFDTDGNELDAHDGQLFQVGSTVYLIGTSYGCGFQYQNATPIFCGFRVYSTTDMVTWINLGYLFDATISKWQTECNPGCVRAHMVYNVANNNYVLWFAGDALHNGYVVFTCTTPYSGCTHSGYTSTLAEPAGGDFALFVDPQNTANAYLLYSVVSATPPQSMFIQKLNANFTDGDGGSANQITNSSRYEAPFMFYNTGTTNPYVIGWSHGCSYCDGGEVYSANSTSPMGTYANTELVNSTNCGGQALSAIPLTANGTTTVVFTSDQWFGPGGDGYANQALANIYFQPLTFDGSGSIVPFSCTGTVSIPGFLTTLPKPPRCPAGADQCSFGDGFLAYYDHASPQYYRMQTFVSTFSTLSKIEIPLGQQNTCIVTNVCGGALNADPTIELVSLDGSNNPVSVLASQTIDRTTINWSVSKVTVTFNYSGLTPGGHYGIVLINGASQGYLAFAVYAGSTNPYPAGVERYSTNSGSTWTTESGFALMFATFQ